jgi:hypothetical protein
MPFHPALVAMVLACAFALSAAGAARSAPPKPLPAPVELAPADRATVPSLPAFTWKRVAGAVRYEVQVAASRNFSSLITDGGQTLKTRNTAATVDRTHPDGQYFWRVRAVSASGRAGRWTATRELTKRWDLRPQLLTPEPGEAIVYPGRPLLLDWAPVTGALRYEVIVGTDETLSQPAIGRGAVTTAGTVLNLPGTLAPGKTYFWAVTPLDGRGNRGARSEVRSFVWEWPTRTTTQPVTDLDPRPEVFDPLLRWAAVPGAARYEVEVSASDVFAPGSKVCCDDKPLNTAYAPRKVLPNNRYFWRVRPVDASGNPGEWTGGPEFVKSFAPLAPTVPSLRLQDADRAVGPDAGAATDDERVPSVTDPVVRWDAVPGASAYEVRVVPFNTGTASCNWTANGTEQWTVLTATTAWAPQAGQWNNISPTGERVSYDPGKALVDGRLYCARVRAHADRDATREDVRSDWTQLRTAGVTSPVGAAAFRFRERAPLGLETPTVTTPDTYTTPAIGTVSTATPVFTWKPVRGAAAYYVVVARDPDFTNVVDTTLTTHTVHAPRYRVNPLTYADEASSYFWAVVPTSSPNGNGIQGTPQSNHGQPFFKQSVAPVGTGPEMLDGHPLFRWTPAEGARSYRLQVARDPSFGSLVEDVTTNATAYAALETHPVDAQLFWRVRATDETGIGLSWSAVQTYTRSLPVPALDAGNPLGGTVIPALSWSPVPGAIGYDLHVDQADGTKKEFRVPTSAFTPVGFYGTGVWSYRVRGVFPGERTAEIKGAYSPSRTFTRSIGVPTSATTDARRGRLVFSWAPVDGAKLYQVEVATTTSFERPLIRKDVDAPVYAPLLDREELLAGNLFWRVRSLDEGDQEGGWKVGSFSAGAALKLTLSGKLKVGRTVTLKLAVKDGQKVVKGATVALSGAGISRRVKTDRKGRAKLKVRPGRAGTLELKASTGDGRFGRRTFRVR